MWKTCRKDNNTMCKMQCHKHQLQQKLLKITPAETPDRKGFRNAFLFAMHMPCELAAAKPELLVPKRWNQCFPILDPRIPNSNINLGNRGVTGEQGGTKSPLPKLGAPVPPKNNFQNYFQGGFTSAIFYILKCRYPEIISRNKPP